MVARLSCMVFFAAVSLLLGRAAVSEELVRIGLSVPNYGPYAPVYIADELGYYAKDGIKVEVTAYRGGSAAQQAMAGGAAEIINYFPPGVALAVKSGMKEKIIGPGMPTPIGWHILVLGDSPIKSLEGLANKKIGITAKGSTTDFFALWAAKRAGVSVLTVPLGGAGLAPGLKSGNVDAIVLFSPVTFKMLASGEARSLADLGKEMEPTLPDVWVASQKMIDEKPKVVENVLRAIYRATVYMQQNRDYSLKYLKTFTKESNDAIVAQEFDEIIVGRSTDARIERSWLEASLELAEIGGVTGLPPISEIYTDKFAHVSGK